MPDPTVHVTVRFLDSATDTPVAVTEPVVATYRLAGESTPSPLSLSPLDPGVYAGSFTAAKRGIYAIEAMSADAVPAMVFGQAEVRERPIEVTVFSDDPEDGCCLVPTSPHVTSYTLQFADAHKAVEIASASAAVVTIPPHASVPFEPGTVIEVVRMGAGTVEVVAGAGVTMNAAVIPALIVQQYGSVSLRQRDYNEWVVTGDLDTPGGGDLHYSHAQTTASATWVIPHGFGRHPVKALVRDTAGTEHSGTQVDDSMTQCTIYFSLPFSGTAELS